MKHFRSILIIIITIVIASSCRKDFSTVESFGELEFSQDTIFLDTLFTNIGSATFNLKVFNKSDKDITIPEITLENGINSNYRLNIGGTPGKSFENIDILAKDSLFVFIETTIDFDNIPDPLYTDKLLFDNGNNQQDVDLITLVQDATFIFPGRDPITMEIDNLSFDDEIVEARFLTEDELVFTNERPYVIYGYAVVPPNRTLTIEAGARVHFHDDSGLIINPEASLSVNGTVDEKVVFEGDKLGSAFSDVTGQWGRIWMRSGSKNNVINHAQIKNGSFGILVDSIGTSTAPTLKISNTEIYNNAFYGILGRETNIEGNNLVIGSAGISSLAGTFGGTYYFTHCTFANFWNNSIRSSPAVLINNSSINSETNELETNALIAANFTNCIINGNNNIEFTLDNTNTNQNTFNYNVNNSLIKFNDISGSFTNNIELDFNDNTHYQNNLINGITNFKDTSDNDFRIGENSDAINNASPTDIINDILDIFRDISPDIGAYQHITFEEE